MHLLHRPFVRSQIDYGVVVDKSTKQYAVQHAGIKHLYNASIFRDGPCEYIQKLLSYPFFTQSVA